MHPSGPSDRPPQICNNKASLFANCIGSSKPYTYLSTLLSYDSTQTLSLGERPRLSACSGIGQFSIYISINILSLIHELIDKLIPLVLLAASIFNHFTVFNLQSSQWSRRNWDDEHGVSVAVLVCGTHKIYTLHLRTVMPIAGHPKPTLLFTLSWIRTGLLCSKNYIPRRSLACFVSHRIHMYNIGIHHGISLEFPIWTYSWLFTFFLSNTKILTTLPLTLS